MGISGYSKETVINLVRIRAQDMEALPGSEQMEVTRETNLKYGVFHKQMH